MFLGLLKYMLIRFTAFFVESSPALDDRDERQVVLGEGHANKYSVAALAAIHNGGECTT